MKRRTNPQNPKNKTEGPARKGGFDTNKISDFDASSEYQRFERHENAVFYIYVRFRVFKRASCLGVLTRDTRLFGSHGRFGGSLLFFAVPSLSFPFPHFPFGFGIWSSPFGIWALVNYRGACGAPSQVFTQAVW